MSFHTIADLTTTKVEEAAPLVLVVVLVVVVEDLDGEENPHSIMAAAILKVAPRTT